MRMPKRPFTVTTSPFATRVPLTRMSSTIGLAIKSTTLPSARSSNSLSFSEVDPTSPTERRQRDIRQHPEVTA